MIKKFFGLLLLIILVFSSAYSKRPEGDKDNKKQLNKPSKVTYMTLNINNLEMYFANNGNCSWNPQTNGAGVYFPRGSSNTAVFQDGPILGGLVSGNIRMVGSTYNQALQPGPILPGVVAADPTSEKYRVYKIQKNWKDLEDGPVKTAFQKDYDEWPIDDGAPWEYALDANGKPTSKKVPKFIGDQQAWFVANDLNVGAVTAFYGTQPIGTEWHCLFWAYDQPGALGNIIFKKYKIINKGNNDLDGAYLAHWSDVDLGDGGDDFSGCDTSLSVGYVYNGKPIDGSYGQQPPCTGYDYFQGPTVPSTPEAVANWDFGKKAGFINLPMTAYTFFDRGLPADYSDPALGSIQGATEMFNLMKGLKKNGENWIDPQTNLPSKFMFPGDPVAGRGWIDGANNNPPFPPGDKRITLSSGPFQLMKKDTQELVVGLIIGQGIDRFSSITVMKFYDLTAQSAYNTNFQLPSPPPNPKVVASELDKKIVLYWGEDEAAYNATENYSSNGYAFEGYNIYQLPVSTSGKSSSKLLATYDLFNGVTTILDRDLDMASGVVIMKPVQLGKDAGVKRYYLIERDLINSRELVNGQTYYFAVTSYCYNPDPMAIPATLENPFKVITVIPQGPKPGVTITGAPGNVLTVTKVGASDGVVTPMVMDPQKTTGHKYTVSFDTAGSDVEGEWIVQTYWKVTDNVTSKVVAKSFNQSGDEYYPMFDGIFMKVTGPTLTGIRRDGDLDANGLRGFTFLNDPTNNTLYGSGHRFFNPQDWTDLGLQAYGTDYVTVMSFGWPGEAGAISWFKPTTVGADQLKKIEIRWNSDKTKWQKGYRYMRAATSAPASPAYAPFIINKAAGYSYQDYVDVPWTAWDVDAKPERQLACGFMENNEAAPNGEVDGRWKPTTAYGAAGNCGREFMFIFASTYTATAQDKYTKTSTGAVASILNPNMDLMYVGLLSRRTATRVWPNDPGASGIDVKVGITPYYPNSKAVTFTFDAPAAKSYDASKATTDVDKITVFPNPYYGFQNMETNKFNRYVTFNHLPQQAKIRIFTLAGTLVRTLEKNDDTQYINWDLNNDNRLAVASGMYIAYIDMPGIGTKKIVKIAVIMEAQILDRI